MVDAKLLEILICPVSKGTLVYHKETDELWCKQSGLSYRIDDDIPVMIEDEARILTEDELASMAK